MIDGAPGWSLNAIIDANTYIVWYDLFETNDAAIAEFEHTLAEEGMGN